MPRKPSQGLPTRKQILDFIESSGQPAGKREIARAFGLSSHDKIMLKALLKDMADEGLIDSSPGRAFHKAGGVPRVTVLRVVSIDDGQVWATPENWHADTPPPKLRVVLPLTLLLVSTAAVAAMPPPLKEALPLTSLLVRVAVPPRTNMPPPSPTAQGPARTCANAIPSSLLPLGHAFRPSN